MNSPTMPKFCKDCAHFSHQAKRPPKCAAPDAIKIDLVFGELATDCFDARLDTGACGSDGRLFTPVVNRAGDCA